MSPVRIIERIEQEINEAIDKKTSWGRNELKLALSGAIKKAAASLLQEAIDEVIKEEKGMAI